MADYSIDISCRHGERTDIPVARITRADFDSEYDEWNLPGNPASQVLAGDELIADAETGVINQPIDQATDVRLKYSFACPGCGLSFVVREGRLTEILTSFKDSNKYRLTLDEIRTSI